MLIAATATPTMRSVWRADMCTAVVPAPWFVQRTGLRASYTSPSRSRHSFSCKSTCPELGERLGAVDERRIGET
jgi:hypothetical protein